MRSLAPAWPLVFVLGVALGLVAPRAAAWLHHAPSRIEVPAVTAGEASSWPRSGDGLARYPVEVIRTIDGDTFEARVNLWPGLAMVTRVRLRGIDAPELKAACAREYDMARAAAEALRSLLAQDHVTIFNIGPDKYNGRVVADAATRQTPNVSAALRDGGFARAYHGGHRAGWCGGS